MDSNKSSKKESPTRDSGAPDKSANQGAKGQEKQQGSASKDSSGSGQSSKAGNHKP